ncbi:MAG: ribonuclease HII [Candidatus Hydrogenedentes bacterium]|nr:ribonuclease HII [Candidatus Hydrogenedentota bacterium]
MEICVTTDFFLEQLKEKVSQKEKKRLRVMLSIEETLWAQGFSRIAGTDEAGRGPLAGPLVAAAAVLKFPIPGLNDSKKLSEARREVLYEQILAEGHAIGVAIKSANDIDQHGIQHSNMSAMLEAVNILPEPPDFILVDGYNLIGLSQPVMRVIKGDARSLNIAAASIVAKVTHDRLLLKIDECYPGYGFTRNKGYGTREHLEAIKTLGPCPEHRMSFAPLAKKKIHRPY